MLKLHGTMWVSSVDFKDASYDYFMFVQATEFSLVFFSFQW
jgi:hypothetical protein